MIVVITGAEVPVADGKVSEVTEISMLRYTVPVSVIVDYACSPVEIQ